MSVPLLHALRSIHAGARTVAFAVPIYQHRGVIRANRPLLLTGVLVGTTTSVTLAYGLASLLGLDPTTRLSLVPRSMSTPFAMIVAGKIGGVPELTAVFVVITGLLGGLISAQVART